MFTQAQDAVCYAVSGGELIMLGVHQARNYVGFGSTTLCGRFLESVQYKCIHWKQSFPILSGGKSSFEYLLFMRVESDLRFIIKMKRTIITRIGLYSRLNIVCLLNCEAKHKAHHQSMNGKQDNIMKENIIT